MAQASLKRSDSVTHEEFEAEPIYDATGRWMPHSAGAQYCHEAYPAGFFANPRENFEWNPVFPGLDIPEKQRAFFYRLGEYRCSHLIQKVDCDTNLLTVYHVFSRPRSGYGWCMNVVELDIYLRLAAISQKAVERFTIWGHKCWQARVNSTELPEEDPDIMIWGGSVVAYDFYNDLDVEVEYTPSEVPTVSDSDLANHEIVDVSSPAIC